MLMTWTDKFGFRLVNYPNEVEWRFIINETIFFLFKESNLVYLEKKNGKFKRAFLIEADARAFQSNTVDKIFHGPFQAGAESRILL